MRSVLLIANEAAHVRELSRLAEVLMRTPDLRPVVFMEQRLAGLGEPAVFTERGIEVLSFDSFATGEHGSLSRSWSRRRLLAYVLANEFISRRMPMRFCYGYGLFKPNDSELTTVSRNDMRRRVALYERVLKQRAYAAIVVCEDNVELDTSVWIAVARRNGVRSVIVPYTISNTLEFAESYVGFPPYQFDFTAQNRLVADLFPAWVMQYKGRRFLRTSYVKIVATEQLGLTPPNPWLLNSGFADAIAVESPAMRDYYRAAGIPDDQLVTTGSIADDVMATALADVPRRRRALLASLGRADDRPLLLCALPPDQGTYDRPGCEFESFDDMLAFWGESLAAVENWNVVVRPHPKTPPERLDTLRAKGLLVTLEDTAALVPLCELYVASVSATIRWAVACGKPVINYDVYHYGYDDYAGLSAVQTTNTRTEFLDTLREMTGNEEHRARLAAIQHREAPRWGMLDGASGKRMVELLRAPGAATHG